MNKQDLITKIAQDTGISKTNATAAVESFFDGITKSLKKGQPITFVGFPFPFCLFPFPFSCYTNCSVRPVFSRHRRVAQLVRAPA
jgi:hypothetical protein